MRRILPLLLVLAGCAQPDEIMEIKPVLSCPTYLKCHVITWRVGIRYGPQIAGSHVECRCWET